MTHADHAAFARRWAEAIIGTSYVSMGRRALTSHLLVLTHRLVDAALAVEFDPSVARQVGVDMVAAHFTGTETLKETLALIAEWLPGLLTSVPPGIDATGRVAQLVGSLAAGYAGALRERSLDEQDAIYRAGLRARRQAEQALAESEAKFRAMFIGAAIGIGIGDLEGNITDANPALLQMFGYTLEELTQLNVRWMVHPEDTPGAWQVYEDSIRGERDHYRVEKPFYRADGGEIWTHVTVSLVRDETGAPAYQVAMLEDISERRRLQAKLQYQAYHDPLTALANRQVVTERLGRVFAGPAGQRRVGLCFLDLDGFKVVNDSLGHDVGDQLLKTVASRLTRCCGEGPLVARMGGDEFVIIVEDTAGETDVAALADKILTAMAAPIRVGEHELNVTTSIGVVEQPVADTNAEDLLQAADITMYQAKADGKARYVLFDRNRNANEVARFTLSATMLAAVERGEFFVEYQPLVALPDGILRGVEALVRWQHPTFGVLGPDQFIDLAEDSGAIVQLGYWVLARACEQARVWHDAFGDAAPLVSVNLAPRQLHEPGLVADVMKVLADNELDPCRLQLELTEQSLMGDDSGPLMVLTKLYGMGVRIALDDFGDGYWNLPDLRRLPLRELKLAGSFAAGLQSPCNSVDQRIVRALVDLAHALDLTVTAEGVETLAQCERFQAAGCDTGQGAWFGLPSAPEQIDALLRGANPLSNRETP
ncbi:MAG: putative bifunctional diguanylate cyclase/phosphodiesterase [Pseudonocardiaceae bacterium]